MEIMPKVYKTLAVLGAVGIFFGMGKVIYHSYQRGSLQNIPEVRQTFRLEKKVVNLERKMNSEEEFESPMAETIYRYAFRMEYEDRKKEFDELMAKPEVKIARIDIEKHHQGGFSGMYIILGSIAPLCIGAVGWTKASRKKREAKKKSEQNKD